MILLGTKIAVEKAKNDTALNQTGFYKTKPMVSDSYGVITHVGSEVTEPRLQVGVKVYFGNQRYEIRVSGQDLQVMDTDNVVFIDE